MNEKLYLSEVPEWQRLAAGWTMTVFGYVLGAYAFLGMLAGIVMLMVSPFVNEIPGDPLPLAGIALLIIGTTLVVGLASYGLRALGRRILRPTGNGHAGAAVPLWTIQSMGAFLWLGLLIAVYLVYVKQDPNVPDEPRFLLGMAAMGTAMIVIPWRLRRRSVLSRRH